MIRPEELEDLKVSVDDVLYMPSLDAPAERPHPFAYFITITNDSPVSVRIRARKWIVKESDGEVVVVEGDGVVGKQPLLKPGQHFTYNSYHVIHSNSEAEGAFFGQTADGRVVYSRIPVFSMTIPQWAIDDE